MVDACHERRPAQRHPAAIRSVPGCDVEPSWSAPRLPLIAALAPARRDEAADKRVEAGCEPFVAVVDPGVRAEGDQGGEPVGRQRPQERMQLAPGRGVSYSLLVDRGQTAERETDGVVVDEGEGQAGLPF